LASSGQTKPPPAKAPGKASLPAPKQIIDRFIKELGGEEAIRKIDAQRMKGKIDMGGQGLSGNLEVLAKRPDKIVMKITMAGIGELLQGYDGKVGWSMNPVTGPMVLEGKMLEQVKEQARFYAVLHEPGEFKSMQTAGVVNHDGKEAYQLKLVRKSGQEVIEYYDTQTGLLIGSSEVQETPLGAIAVSATIGDYKKFGEVLFATRMTQKMGPLAQVMSFESMEFDGVEDAAFDLPPEIKALIKKK
jgi:hypothetical protein